MELSDLVNGTLFRSKATDLATYILGKKDLGCTSARNVTIIEEAKHIGSTANEFWSLLGGMTEYSCELTQHSLLHPF